MKYTIWCKDVEHGDVYKGSILRALTVISSEQLISSDAAFQLLMNATATKPVECVETDFWVGREIEVEKKKGQPEEVV